MNSKTIDLEVDYIDSRSVTKKELDEISAYIRSRKFKPTSKISLKRELIRKKKEFVELS